MDTKEQLLQVMLGEALSSIETNVTGKVDEVETQLNAKLEGIRAMALDGMRDIEAIIDKKPFSVNLGTLEKPKTKLVHSSFKLITKILAAAKRKEKHIMMVGEAGSGKTQLAANIAEALKLQFYPMSVGLQTTKSDLLGFINAQGNYVTTPVRNAYENGGLLLLDEFDAAHAGVVTILNSLLANGHCSFPDKIVERHPNFVCVCACNTYGRGANINYVGRNRLDAATLDRFIVVDVGYDNKLEKKLTGNDKWNAVIKQVRKNINKQGIKMIVSPRASMDGADLLEAGFKPKEVFDMVIAKGCDDDTKKKLMEDVDLSDLEIEIPEPKEEPKKEEPKQDYQYDVSCEFNYKDNIVQFNVYNPELEKYLLEEEKTFQVWLYKDRNSSNEALSIQFHKNFTGQCARLDKTGNVTRVFVKPGSVELTNDNETLSEGFKDLDGNELEAVLETISKTKDIYICGAEGADKFKDIKIQFRVVKENGIKRYFDIDLNKIRTNFETGEQMELEF